MKNNIITIVKKELMRLIGDKRILFGAVLLPGIMIYVLYSFMGSAFSDAFNDSADFEEKPFVINVVNMPESIDAIFKLQQIEYTSINESNEDDIKAIKSAISEQWHDLLVIFPKDFDALIEEYDIKDGNPAPNVNMFFNSTSSTSSQAYYQVNFILDTFESQLINKFDVNNNQEIDADNSDIIYDLADEKDLSAMIFSSMMPMLLIMFLFSGCMAIAPESIAGEKERGTLSTLLVTPLKRRELALGKILSITIIAVMSAASSTVGTLLSLPKLMGSEMEQIGIYYTVSDYVLIAIVILSTVLLFVSFISIISAFAKSVKEAQTYVIPLMLVAIISGISGMLGSSSQGLTIYLIPIYNSVQSMSSIFGFEAQTINILTTVISNLVYVIISAFALTKMFNSERIMFSR